jgi:hypothetical protein
MSPSKTFFNAFFTVLSSDMLSTCPKHHHTPSINSQTTSGSVYRSFNFWLVRILYRPFSFTGTNVFLIIFLSQIQETGMWIYSWDRPQAHLHTCTLHNQHC